MHVWVAPLLVPPPIMASLLAGLTPEERTRAARYRHPEDARRFSAARGWLRRVLAAELDTTPELVQLAESATGKPRLAGGTGPSVNLSHAGELALVAVAGREVGVDVEHEDSGPRGLDALAIACSPAEAAALDRLPAARRADAFLRHWTAKEAYLKGTGLGLAVAPHCVEVGLALGGGAGPVRVSGDSGPSRWQVQALRPAPGYVGAVAAEGADWVVEIHSTAHLPPFRPERP